MFKPTSKGTSAAASNHLSVTNQSTAADLCVLLQHEKLKRSLRTLALVLHYH